VQKGRAPSEIHADPIFVVGSPRSGTTLLYHMLVSTGAFLDYRAETHFFDLFLPRYGDPRSARRREALADAWLGSSYHARTGLEDPQLRGQLLERGTTPGRFLAFIMAQAADAQSRPRWADCTPAHVRHMDSIKREIPSARFLHIVRDGRDVALSLAPRGWARPLPWDRRNLELVAAWAWQYDVEIGRRLGAKLGRNAYHEVRFEELVRDTGSTLEGLSDFVETPLGLAALQRAPVGSVVQPNTSFQDAGGDFDPVGRWKTHMDRSDLEKIEATVGATLRACGYSTTTDRRAGLPLRARHQVAKQAEGLRAFLKNRTPLARLVIDPLTAAPPLTLPEDPPTRDSDSTSS